MPGRPSGLRTLVQGVQSYFTAQSITAAVAAGWKARTFQLNEGPGLANRVVFMPGDEAGNMGELTQPRLKSSSPRCLRQLHEIITVSVWAADTSSPVALEDELLQQDAVENLLEVTFQAIQSIALADWIAGTMRETRPGGEMAFGRERLFQFVLREEFFDVTLVRVFPAPAIVKQIDPPGGSS